MLPCIASIVEGHGEIEALPVLVRRILEQQQSACFADVRRPRRIAKSLLLRPGEMERAIQSLAKEIDSKGAILVVIDSDGSAPCRRGPQLLVRARSARTDLPVAVVLAHHEWESWYLSAAKSLSACRGLHDGLTSPHDPESIQGAKEWLTRHMQPGRAYSPTADQAALASSLDLQAARRAPSFDKFYREVVRLFRDASALQRV
jgi:hypothetical protein